jgi:hypothetical protein
MLCCRSQPDGGSLKVNALPSLDMVSLMAVMVEHVEFSRDYVVT